MFVVWAVGLQGAVAQRQGRIHSITVQCPHRIPLVLARSPQGLPGAIGSQQCSGRARSDRCWGRGDSREWSNDSLHQPCNYSPDGACVCETRAKEQSIHLPAQVSVLALLQQGWMWGINSLTPPQSPQPFSSAHCAGDPQIPQRRPPLAPTQRSVSLRTIADCSLSPPAPPC